MYPHERSLVKKMSDKPFALVGVNSDRDMEALKPVLKEENITWRSFQNQPKDAKGSISDDWAVQGWPTLFVIDHKGVIRHKWLGSPGNEAMDKAIEHLVEAAEKDAKPAK